MMIAKWRQKLDRPRDLLLLAKMQLWLLWLAIGRAFRPVGALTAGLRPRRTDTNRASDSRCDALARYARFVVWLNRLWIRNPCLYQCLLMYRFIRLEGREAEIAFGVRREGDTLTGHTWILLDGRVFGDTREHVARYHVIWKTG